jgi:valyl-tRNA synthetase
VDGYRAFANKVWNATRFALMNLEEERPPHPAEIEGLELADRWILSRFARASGGVTESLERFRFSEAANQVYAFIWGELADWYLELAKPRLQGAAGDQSRDAARATLVHVLDGALRLLHPFMPFVTEELWQRLPRAEGDPAALMVASWPGGEGRWLDPAAETEMEALQEVIGAVRNLRAEYGVPPGARVRLRLSGGEPAARAVLAASGRALHDLARVEALEEGGADGAVGAHAVLRSGIELFLPLEGVLDLGRERERLRGELERVERLEQGTRGRLGNAGFVERAPAEVVEKEREKLASLSEQREKLSEKLRSLEGTA